MQVRNLRNIQSIWIIGFDSRVCVCVRACMRACVHMHVPFPWQDNMQAQSQQIILDMVSVLKSIREVGHAYRHDQVVFSEEDDSINDFDTSSSNWQETFGKDIR